MDGVELDTTAPQATHPVGTSFMRGMVDFEADMGGMGDTSGGVPSVDTSTFDQSTAALPDTTSEQNPDAEAGLNAQQLADMVRSSHQELGDLFRSTVAQQQQPVQQPGYDQPVQQPVQQSGLDQALANFDPFNPQSLQQVLAAQAADMGQQFQQQLESMRNEVMPFVQDHVQTQGHQAATAELTGFESHIGHGFDHGDAINAARELLASNPQMSERDALWYGANQVAQKERAIGQRYVQAYQTHLRTLAGAGEGEPPVAAASDQMDLGDERYQGSGKYARLVKDRMAADRRQAAHV